MAGRIRTIELLSLLLSGILIAMAGLIWEASAPLSGTPIAMAGLIWEASDPRIEEAITSTLRESTVTDGTDSTCKRGTVYHPAAEFGQQCPSRTIQFSGLMAPKIAASPDRGPLPDTT
jgi:hypothetical protein